MPNLIEILKNVNDFEKMKLKKKYSEPKIYTGGIDISKWSKLSEKEKKKALKKHWCVYYSFRNPKTDKLERQDNIKGGVNYYKTKEERLEILDTYRKNLSRLLKQGYNPYEDNNSEINKTMSIEEAFEFGLKMKEKTLAEVSYSRMVSKINRFKLFLIDNRFFNRFITSIDKKIVNKYLNSILETTSPRNRNNARADISSLFRTLEDNDIISFNFISKISVLKSTPKINKTYSDHKLKILNEYLENNDKILLLFIIVVRLKYDFIKNCFLRSVNPFLFWDYSIARSLY